MNRFLRRILAVWGFALLAATVVLEAVGASELNSHDVDGDGVSGAQTQNVCPWNGLLTVRITYTIMNEATLTDNPYTIDWKTADFRVTNVEAGKTRSTSIVTHKSCPTKSGPVKWIDIPDGDIGAVAPHRGMQSFPAPAEVPGWVILNAAGDLLKSVLSHSENETLKFTSTYFMDGVPVFTFTSEAHPVNPGTLASNWNYTYAATNTAPASHAFTNSLVPTFSSVLAPGQTGILQFDAAMPCGFGPGNVTLTDFGDVFPIVAAVETGCGVGEPFDLVPVGGPVPTVGTWGAVLLLTGLLTTGIFVVRQRDR